ncbi:hypothetical protein ALMP_40300 [Streptomyces sp. A012304]|nr:hypothetical protein ALMP_40300 [Streptomyces sp. A012304]
MDTLNVSIYAVNVQPYRFNAPRSAVRLGPAVATIDWSSIDIALVSKRDARRRGKRDGSGREGAGVGAAAPLGRPEPVCVIGTPCQAHTQPIGNYMLLAHECHV